MRKVKGRSSYLLKREFPALKKRYWEQRFWGSGLVGFCLKTGSHAESYRRINNRTVHDLCKIRCKEGDQAGDVRGLDKTPFRPG